MCVEYVILIIIGIFIAKLGAWTENRLDDSVEERTKWAIYQNTLSGEYVALRESDDHGVIFEPLDLTYDIDTLDLVAESLNRINKL